MGGFQVPFPAALVPPDARRIIYTSESGPKIFQYDLIERRQLPELVSFADNEGKFFFDVAFDRAGRLLVVNGRGVDAYDLEGRLMRSYPLDSSAGPDTGAGGGDARLCDELLFSGQIARLDLESGAIVARAETGIRKSLSGAAEFPG